MSRAADAADVLRAASAASDLLRARGQARAELGSAPTRGDIVVFRVLGVRQLTQAVLGRASGLRYLGAGVDALHAASMVPVLLVSRRWRRAAAVQIVFSVVMIVLSVGRD
jgi:hypothetical protein